MSYEFLFKDTSTFVGHFVLSAREGAGGGGGGGGGGEDKIANRGGLKTEIEYEAKLSDDAETAD